MVRKEKRDGLEIKANKTVLSSLVQAERSRKERPKCGMSWCNGVCVLFMHVSECLMYRCGTCFPSTACVWKL